MGPFVMFDDRVVVPRSAGRGHGGRRAAGWERDNPFFFGFGRLRRGIADNVTQIHMANYQGSEHEKSLYNYKTKFNEIANMNNAPTTRSFHSS